jgi:hypothetical protein
MGTSLRRPLAVLFQAAASLSIRCEGCAVTLFEPEAAASATRWGLLREGRIVNAFPAMADAP